MMAIGFTINSLWVLTVQKQLHWSLWKTEGDKKLIVKSWSPSTAMHSPIWLLMACQQQEFANASIQTKHVLSSVTSGTISVIMFASPIAYAIAVLFVFASSHCPPPTLVSHWITGTIYSASYHSFCAPLLVKPSIVDNCYLD